MERRGGEGMPDGAVQTANRHGSGPSNKGCSAGGRDTDDCENMLFVQVFGPCVTSTVVDNKNLVGVGFRICAT